MRIGLGVLFLAAFLPAVAPLFAQDDYPKAEIFGGFSYLPANGMDFPRKNSFGFQASVTGNITRSFGIVGDFGGQYRKASNLGPGYPGVTANTSVYEYLAGPRFAARAERVTVFVHALVGGAAGRTSLSGFSDSQFAFGGGGGVDINLNRYIAIRAIQIDYIGSFVDIVEHNARLGFGIVIKLGGS
jgi:hypothetical protein